MITLEKALEMPEDTLGRRMMDIHDKINSVKTTCYQGSYDEALREMEIYKEAYRKKFLND